MISLENLAELEIKLRPFKRFSTMTFSTRHTNHYTILAIYIYVINSLICPPSLTFLISKFSPPFGVLWCAFFLSFWDSQIGPSNPLKSGCALPLMALISGHFWPKFAFRLIWGFLRVLGSSEDGTNNCIYMYSIKMNPLVRYGGPGEGVKRVK